jgi:hypothetical protein
VLACNFYTCLNRKPLKFSSNRVLCSLFFLWVCLFNMLMFYWTPNWFCIAWEPFWFKGGLWWDHSCICTRRWPTLKRYPFFPAFFLTLWLICLALSLRARALRMIPNCVGFKKRCVVELQTSSLHIFPWNHVFVWDEFLFNFLASFLTRFWTQLRFL